MFHFLCTTVYIYRTLTDALYMSLCLSVCQFLSDMTVLKLSAFVSRIHIHKYIVFIDLDLAAKLAGFWCTMYIKNVGNIK